MKNTKFFILLLIPILSIFANPLQQYKTTGKLSNQLDRLDRYLKSDQISFGNSKRTPKRQASKTSNSSANLSVSATYLHKLNRKNFQTLHKIFKNQTELLHHFRDFMIQKSQLQLSTIKINSQQLKTKVSSALENISLSKSSLSRINKHAGQLHQQLETIVIDYMNNPQYDQLISLKRKIRYEEQGFSEPLINLCKLLIVNLSNLHGRLNNLTSLIEEAEANNWRTSNRQLTLTSQTKIKRHIQADLKQTIKDFKLIKQHFEHTNSEILNQLPGKRALPRNIGHKPDYNKQKRYEQFLVEIETTSKRFFEQELLNINICYTKSAKQTSKQQPLYLTPLSRHLFFNNNTGQSTIPNSEQIATKLPDWI